MNKLLLLEFALVTGFISYQIAKNNRLSSPKLWAVLGAVFSVFGVAAVAIVSKYVNDRRKGYAK
jgi:hypothetical protein